MISGPLVSIIIPTVNTPALTGACLRAVLKNTSLPYEILVVNNSRGKAIARCLKSFPRVRVLRNPRNLGFAKAVNQGARMAQGKYVCFLNSDTLVPPKWLERLVKTARRPCVGAVGPLARVQFDRPFAGSSSRLLGDETAALLADQAARRWYQGRLFETNCLWGFCLLVPKKVLVRMGYFDERFFFGCEDDDFCLRLRMAGYRLFSVRSLFVHHAGSGSIRSAKRRRWVHKSRSYLFRKWEAVLGRKHVSPIAFLKHANRLILTHKRSPSGAKTIATPNGLSQDFFEDFLFSKKRL